MNQKSNDEKYSQTGITVKIHDNHDDHAEVYRV